MAPGPLEGAYYRRVWASMYELCYGKRKSLDSQSKADMAIDDPMSKSPATESVGTSGVITSAAVKVVNRKMRYLVKLLSSLEERNVSLFTRIVGLVDETTLKEIESDTKTAVKNGGLLTTDGSRQKTKGGVFIKCLKQRLKGEVIDRIWAQQKLEQAKFKRELRKTATGYDKLIRKVSKQCRETELAGGEVHSVRSATERHKQKRRNKRRGSDSDMELSEDTAMTAAPSSID